MKRLSIVKIIIVLFFISQSKVALAQINIDQDLQVEYERLTEELDYSDSRLSWELKENEINEEEENQEYDNPTPTSDININGGFTNALAYVLIVLLLIGVIFMIFHNVKLDKKISQDDLPDDYIEDIEEVNTIDGFREALNAGDYRSAIRMQFIKVLQILQENNHINWKPEKTNRDYLKELNGTTQKNDFRKLSSIYELVWYGNTKIERESFEQLNPSFEKFINHSNGK